MTDEIFKDLEKKLIAAQKKLIRRLANDAYKIAYDKFGNPQEGWPELAPMTQETHMRHASSIQAAGFEPTESMLYVTGKLRGSVEMDIGDLEASVGTNEPAMLTQEFGRPNPISNMQAIPPRPVFEPTAVEIESKMAQYIEKIVGPEFGKDVQINITVTGR